jgi:DNA modification methylase
VRRLGTVVAVPADYGDRFKWATADVWSVRATGHPCPKPLSLMRLMLSKATPVMSVLDPFAGSGTTLRAAKDVDKRAVGIEINPAYCEIAARRLAQDVLDFGEASA